MAGSAQSHMVTVSRVSGVALVRRVMEGGGELRKGEGDSIFKTDAVAGVESVVVELLESSGV